MVRGQRIPAAGENPWEGCQFPRRMNSKIGTQMQNAVSNQRSVGSAREERRGIPGFVSGRPPWPLRAEGVRGGSGGRGRCRGPARRSQGPLRGAGMEGNGGGGGGDRTVPLRTAWAAGGGLRRQGGGGRSWTHRHHHHHTGDIHRFEARGRPRKRGLDGRPEARGGSGEAPWVSGLCAGVRWGTVQRGNDIERYGGQRAP